MLTKIQANKRMFLLALLIIGLALQFWSGSRYPSLNEKAIMGGQTNLEGSLSFEATILVQEGDPLYVEIGKETVNWIMTNRRGMTFGVLMAAAVLTMLSLLKRRSFKNSFLNTIAGFMTGTPLGVCVNCAAPIAKGLHDSGARLETTLATLFSSPTMNIVVLTMLFSIFPFYIAAIKIGATLFLIFVLIPFLSRYVFRKEAVATHDAACCIVNPVENRPPEDWVTALKGGTVDYFKNLWYIIYKTVPLMFVAGFLGSVMMAILPLETLLQNLEVSILGAIGVAILGVFLPVPIAFDVIVSSALMAAGIPVFYGMLLLFTLGTFSIYSSLVIWRTVSLRVAVILYTTVAVVGLGAAIVAQQWDQSEVDEMWDVFDEAHAATTPKNIALDYVPFAKKHSEGDKPFKRVQSDEMGLNRPNFWEVEDFVAPFYIGRGIGSGDLDKDGWVDVVTGTKEGLMVFRNVDGKKFETYPIDIPEVKKFNTFIVAPVDINNDGWLDLYFSTYMDGNYYILNDKGKFTSKKLVKAPTSDNVLTYSLSFGDIDKDGDLDVAVGNWFYGFAKPIPSEAGINQFQINQNGKFIETKMPGMTGDSLTILLSDFNMDNNIDLIVGNDFDPRDTFAIGDGKGSFRELMKKDGVIPVSTSTTMSVDTADINNDLVPEIFLAQIAARASGKSTQIPTVPANEYCRDIADKKEQNKCQQNMRNRMFFRYFSDFQPSDIKHCRKIKDEQQQRDCKALMVLRTAIRDKKKAYCDKLPAHHERVKILCYRYFEQSVTIPKEYYRESIPSKQNTNALLVPDGKGNFTDEAKKMGVDISGWSWSAKLADLDNDEWQDLYVVNGTWLRTDRTPSNMFFHNQKGKKFEEKAVEWGLDHFMVDPSFTYLDYDRDGDLDVISTSLNGPAWIYTNNESSNQSVAFELDDRAGNRFGIGSKIVIHYGKGKSQYREVKSGGGFVSHDGPVVYFGLGKNDTITGVDITWSTGEKTHIDGPLKAGGIYKVTRQSKG